MHGDGAQIAIVVGHHTEALAQRLAVVARGGALFHVVGHHRADIAEGKATAFEASSKLYDAMEENGRINYFWQMAAAALVEQLYVTTQNTEKFISAFDDSSAESVTFRIILLQDAIERLAVYDPELQPISDAIEPLKVLNAITVDQFKSQLEECKEEISASRKMLFQ